jgi:hypothetical protein
MSQTTGPSIRQLTVDAAAPIMDAANHYDARLIEAFQMMISMAALRARGGVTGWRRPLTADQSVFERFSVDSYDAGDLNFEILPRSIVPQTLMELLEAETKRYQVLQAGQTAHLPLPIVLERAGWTPREIKAVQDAQEEAFRVAQERMQAAMPTQADTQGTPMMTPGSNPAQRNGVGSPTGAQQAARAGQGGNPNGGRNNGAR